MSIHNMRAAKTKTDIRQEQIVRSALTQISRHGLRSLNVAGVARAVGVVPSALYRHYRSKDDMLDAVLDLISQRLQENVQAARNESTDARERLRCLLLRHLEFVRQEVPLPRVILSEEIFQGPRSRRRRVHRLLSDYLQSVAGLIEEGQKEGCICAELPADTLSVMFLGLIQPAVILWLTSDGAFDLAGHSERAWKIFCQAIQSDSSVRSPIPKRTGADGALSTQTRYRDYAKTHNDQRTPRRPSNPGDGTRQLPGRRGCEPRDHQERHG